MQVLELMDQQLWELNEKLSDDDEDSEESGGLAEDWTESYSCRITECDFDEISLSPVWQSVTLLNCVCLSKMIFWKN